MVDTPNGKLRLRAWPKKRGRPKSAAVRENNEWFKTITQLLKYASPDQVRESMKVVVGTGLLPRDMLMKAMSSGFYDIAEPDGQMITYRRKFLERVVYQGLIANVVDGLGMTANTFNPVLMQLPTIDTAGMWDAGDTSTITVPPGVQVIDINLALSLNVATATDFAVIISKVGGGFLQAGNISETIFTNPFAQVSSGPIVVTGGDVFKVWGYPRSTHSVVGSLSRVACQILEAV